MPTVLSPLSVVSYSKDYLVDFVRHITGWALRNEVAEKVQLNYLCRYLETDHLQAKTIVVENEYVDRHYLEDYSEYYARCFPSHPRKCARIHFFSNSFTEQQFVSEVSDNDPLFVEKLQDHYLGFAVIRPIPHTFLAKLCIVPYRGMTAEKGYQLISKVHTVSLFGIPLQVKTTAFLEQDKVVSACATSSLWTLLSASPQISNENLPSPSAITKAASHGMLEGRIFPTIGLSPVQVSRCLKHFGLEPTLLPSEINGNCDALKESIYSYINDNIPVLLGGDVYQSVNGQLKYLGKHLVCVAGYHIPLDQPNKSNFKLRSHGIDKIYVHDDRYGPFVRISMNLTEFECEEEKIVGLELSVHDLGNYFVPDFCMVGLYHKIRIPYSYVSNVCRALHDYIYISHADMQSALQDSSLTENIPFYQRTKEAFDVVLESEWDISLTTGSQIKSQALAGPNFLTFNGATNKSSLLFTSMPKYVWRCRISKDGVPVTDLFFDATEVPQGRVFLGFISYSTISERLWKYVHKLIKDRVWQRYIINDEQIKSHIGTILRFFNEGRDDIYLNTIYGPLGLPRRQLKLGETDQTNSIQIRRDTITLKRGNDDSSLQSRLDQKIKYIWVINEFGDIIIGEDVQESDGSFMGHPTLIDGKPGRIAGELVYSKNLGHWEVNLKSRAYSDHIDKWGDQGKKYLEAVIEYNLRKLNPSIQPKEEEPGIVTTSEKND